MKSADEWVNEMEWGHIPETIEAIRQEQREEDWQKVQHDLVGSEITNDEINAIGNAILNPAKEQTDANDNR